MARGYFRLFDRRSTERLQGGMPLLSLLALVLPRLNLSIGKFVMYWQGYLFHRHAANTLSTNARLMALRKPRFPLGNRFDHRRANTTTYDLFNSSAHLRIFS